MLKSIFQKYSTYLPNKYSLFLPVLGAIEVLMAAVFYRVTDLLIFFFLMILLLGICFVFFKFEELMNFCIILLPNLNVIKYGENGVAIFGYYMILVLIRYICFHGKLKLRPEMFAYALCIFGSFIFNKDTYIVTAFVRNMCTIVLFYCLFNDVRFNNTKFKTQVLKCYVVGAFICVVLGIVYYFLEGLNIFDNDFKGYVGDRNYFSSILPTAIAIALMIIYKEREFKLFYFIAILVMVFGVILTHSRTAFVSLAIVSLIIGALLFSREGRNIVIILLILAFCVLVGFSDILVNSLRTLIERFFGQGMETGNGRTDAWKFFISYMFSSVKNALFGSGYALKYVNAGMVLVVEHNAYIEIPFTIGLIGFFVLISLYYMIYKTISITPGKLKLYSFVPLICILVCCLMLSNGFIDNTMYGIFICFIAIDYTKTKQSEFSYMRPLFREKTKFYEFLF